MDTWGDSESNPLAYVNRVREAMRKIPTYAERMEQFRILDDLLCDLYAYVDDIRASKTGEEYDEIDSADWHEAPEEEHLLERILDALDQMRPE